MFFRQVENVVIESFCHLFSIGLTVRLILLENVLTSVLYFVTQIMSRERKYNVENKVLKL